MKATWASGAIELLKHADSHIGLNSAFDKRIAFVSIDNCVETIIRTYISLPKSKSGIKIKKQEIEDAGNSFPKLLSLLFQYTSGKLIGIEEFDIEHYHRIRNRLYHDGTGLSVDDEYLIAYRGIAEVMLKNLFNIDLELSSSASDSLGKLILNWNSIEHEIKDKLDQAGISGTYKWEEAFALGLVKPNEIQLLTELRNARNKLVHSESIDKEDIKYWLKVSEHLLSSVKASTPLLSTNQSKSVSSLEYNQPAEIFVTYKEKRIEQKVHKYSLEFSIKLTQAPAQKYFRINLLWPAQIPILEITGFEGGEKKNINGQVFKEYTLLVSEIVLPGQTLKMIGDKSISLLEYEFNDNVYFNRSREPFDLYYTVFFETWQPIQDSISFKDLNIF